MTGRWHFAEIAGDDTALAGCAALERELSSNRRSQGTNQPAVLNPVAVIMNLFEKHQLGESDDPIPIETAEHHRTAATRMTQQARLYIDIISRELDPLVYDTPEFVDSLRRLILENRRSRVRILICDPGTVVRRGHRLLDVAQALSSFIELRKPGPEHKTWNGSLFVADETAYVQRFSAERFEGVANFNDKRHARILTQEFEEMWEKSSPDPNFRRISL